MLSQIYESQCYSVAVLFHVPFSDASSGILLTVRHLGILPWFSVAMFSFHLGISLLYKGIIQILNVTLSTEICTYIHRVVTRVETMNGKYCSGFWIRGDKMNWRYVQGREGSWEEERRGTAVHHEGAWEAGRKWRTGVSRETGPGGNVDVGMVDRTVVWCLPRKPETLGLACNIAKQKL